MTLFYLAGLFLSSTVTEAVKDPGYCWDKNIEDLKFTFIENDADFEIEKAGCPYFQDDDIERDNQGNVKYWYDTHAWRKRIKPEDSESGYHELVMTIKYAGSGWLALGFDPNNKLKPKMEGIEAVVMTPVNGNLKDEWTINGEQWRLVNSHAYPGDEGKIPAGTGCDNRLPEWKPDFTGVPRQEFNKNTGLPVGLAKPGQGCIRGIRKAKASDKHGDVYNFFQFVYVPSEWQQQAWEASGGIFLSWARSDSAYFDSDYHHNKMRADVRLMATEVGFKFKEFYESDLGDEWAKVKVSESNILDEYKEQADCDWDGSCLAACDWMRQDDPEAITKCRLDGLYAGLQNVKKVIGDLGRQMILNTVMHEQRVRTSVYSGITIARQSKVGTVAWMDATYVGTGIISMHNHANHKDTVGLGQFGAVINGVTFITRHNDYYVYKRAQQQEALEAGGCDDPETCNSEEWMQWKEYGTIPLEYPDVPPRVLELYEPYKDESLSIEEREVAFVAAVVEMQQWFRAYQEQKYDVGLDDPEDIDENGDPIVRDYRPYFRTALCVLEGGWYTIPPSKSNIKQTLKEFFPSDRHQIDANSWQELHDKTRFHLNSGKKQKDENIPLLPTAIRNIQSGSAWLPEMANWKYTIHCSEVNEPSSWVDSTQAAKPLSIPLANLELNLDKSLLLRNQYPLDKMTSEMVIEKMWHSKSALFKFKDLRGEDKVMYTMMDDFMEQIPGMDGPGVQYIDDAFGTTCFHYRNRDYAVNVGYYNRYYRVQEADAMGEATGKRGFWDKNLWAAMAVENKVVSELTTWDKKTELFYRQRWTWAIPLELQYMTPLKKWNPRNLNYRGLWGKASTDAARHKDAKRVTTGPDGTNLNGSEGRPFDGTNSANFYTIPTEFFTDADPEDVVPADTGMGGVWVLARETDLDAEGNRRKFRMKAGGTSASLSGIGNGVGSVRLRYPVFPVSEHGSLAYKEIKAIENQLEMADALMNQRMLKVEAKLIDLEVNVLPNSQQTFKPAGGAEAGEGAGGPEKVESKVESPYPTLDDTYDAASNEIEVLEGASGHVHILNPTPDDVKSMKTFGQWTWLDADFKNGHIHHVQVRWAQELGEWKMGHCGWNEQECKQVQDKNAGEPAWLANAAFGDEDANGIFFLDIFPDDALKKPFKVEIRKGRLILNTEIHSFKFACNEQCGGSKKRAQEVREDGSTNYGDDIHCAPPSKRGTDIVKEAFTTQKTHCGGAEILYRDYEGKRLYAPTLDAIADWFTIKETEQDWWIYDANEVPRYREKKGKWSRDEGYFGTWEYYGSRPTDGPAPLTKKRLTEEQWYPLNDNVRQFTTRGSLLKTFTPSRWKGTYSSDFGLYFEYSKGEVVLKKQSRSAFDTMAKIRQGGRGSVFIDPNGGAVSDAFKVEYNNGVIYLQTEYASYSDQCNDCGTRDRLEMSECFPREIKDGKQGVKEQIVLDQNHFFPERTCSDVIIRYLDMDRHVISDSQLAALAALITSEPTEVTNGCYDCEKEGKYPITVSYYGSDKVPDVKLDGFNPIFKKKPSFASITSGIWTTLPDTFDGVLSGPNLLVKQLKIRDWKTEESQQGGIYYQFGEGGRVQLKLLDYDDSRNKEDDGTFNSWDSGSSSSSVCPRGRCDDGHDGVSWAPGLAPVAGPGGAEFNANIFGSDGDGDHTHLTFGDIVLITLVEVLFIAGCCLCGGLFSYNLMKREFEEHIEEMDYAVDSGKDIGPE